MNKKPLTIDFETYSHSDYIKVENANANTEEMHNQYNFEQIKARMGEERVEEIFIAMVLAFGPPPTVAGRPLYDKNGGWIATRSYPKGGRLTEFRGLLEKATGTPFSLNETLPWYKEYYTWFAQNTARLSTGKARK